MRRAAERSAPHRGFTLLEAIVAVAILGIALMPLLSFISHAATQLRLAGEANTRSLAEQNILAFVETLNPLVEPKGEIMLGDLQVAWTSRAVVPLIDRTRLGSGFPGYSIGFYEVDVRVARGGIFWFDLVSRKIGYRSLQLSDAPS